MTPPVVISDTQRARSGARDWEANLDVPPGRGANSSVSPRRMTERAHELSAAGAGPRQLSDADAAHYKAATLPQAMPGQQHNDAGTGERGQNTPGRENGRKGLGL